MATKKKEKAIIPVEPKAPAKLGRPSKYSDELAYKICERIAAGESLRHIAMIEGMPCVDTIREWVRDKKDFSAQ